MKNHASLAPTEPQPQLFVSGTFALDLSQIRLGKVVFQYSPRFAVKAVPSDGTSKDVLLNSTQGIVKFAMQHAIPEVALEGVPESMRTFRGLLV